MTPLGRRVVVARFDGGAISTDGGALLLREVEAKIGLLARVAAQFTDHRDPELIEHSVGELVSQRIIGLALGYEDLNDHDRLRFDPLLAVAAGKSDPTGEQRRREQGRGRALASSSTLNRLELTPADADSDARHKKIVADQDGLDRALVEHFIQSRVRAPAAIWLDPEATDDPLHGHQEGVVGPNRQSSVLATIPFLHRTLTSAIQTLTGSTNVFLALHTRGHGRHGAELCPLGGAL